MCLKSRAWVGPIELQFPACLAVLPSESVLVILPNTIPSGKLKSHQVLLVYRVRSFPSHRSQALEMRLEVEAPQLPKHRRCLLGAPEVGALESSHHLPVPVPRPCLDHQAPHAPPAEPPCTHLCTRLEPALPGLQELRHLPAQAVASGEPPGEVVSTPSATASWAPLASTGARCRVRVSADSGLGLATAGF